MPQRDTDSPACFQRTREGLTIWRTISHTGSRHMDKHTSNPNIDPGGWVERYSDVFYRYALSRLHDHQAAEDVVQETFLGAIRSAESFEHRSDEKTWMTTILRRKIIDVIRKRERARKNQPANQFVDVGHCCEDDCKTVFGSSFSKPPSSDMTEAEFVAAVECCLGVIPKSQADVFVLRELEQKTPEEICELLDITRKNLWTRLYRARIALAACINEKYECTQGEEENHAQQQ